MLYTVDGAAQKIRENRAVLVLAGDEKALRKLPRGRWIAGTIPYFIDCGEGVSSRERVYVTELPPYATGVQIRSYSAGTLPAIFEDAPGNGFTIVIIPAGSLAHTAYALGAPTFPGVFLKPVVGWVSGVHDSEIGVCRPKVVNGEAGAWSSEGVVAVHVTLPEPKTVEMGIVNAFRPGPGECIQFPDTGFKKSSCLVAGKETSFAGYLRDVHADIRLPLTADYNGSVINVSIQSVDQDAGLVKLYAPAFPGIEYRLAAPVADYVAAFESAVGNGGPQPIFACNCILNYRHSGLEGRKTRSADGPITFGEIANVLLNQTLVQLFVRD